MSRYDKARAAHEYLWRTYGAANDMTGGYVDQHDLETLLESPTKTTAARCYENQIRYWFAVGPDPFGKITGDWREDPKVREIGETYADELDFDRISWVCAPSPK